MSKKDTIYFDNAATTFVLNEVLEQMPDIYKKFYANPNSIHSEGEKSRSVIENSRKKIASIIGCKPEELIFTSCATESNNTIIRGLAEKYPEKKEILVSPIEHKSVLNPIKYLGNKGYKIKFLKIDNNGVIDLDYLKKSISKNTLFVSVIHGNNETGVLQDIEEIGKICRERNVFFFSDTVQSFLKAKIPLEVLDFFSISGHKIGAPKGTGMFFKKDKIEIEPLLFGGGQERGLRSGTENTQGIKFLADVVEVWKENKEKYIEHLTKLRNYFELKLKEEIPDVEIVSEKVERLPHISCVIFPKIDAQTLILSLDTKGVAVSSGSACSSGTPEPSHVLLAYGYKPEEALRAVRFSFGIKNNLEEIDICVNYIKEIYGKYMTFMNFS